MKIWRAATLALAAWFSLLLVYVVARRFVYPYDLEWMEGGELCHALRFIDHEPLYAPPSVDFIPYLYTPGYPWLLFVLSKVFPFGYRLGRAVSLLAYFGTALLGYVYVRRETQSRAVAAVVFAIPCAAFVPTGSFYDLARPDSLFLFFVVAALMLGWWRRAQPIAGGLVPALLMIAAFYTKQTSSVFMVALGVALLATAPRTAVVYGLTLAVVGLPALWASNRASDGWFWTYTSVLHRKHDFFPGRAFFGTPGRLFLLIGPGLLLVPWALARRRTPALVHATFLAVVGIFAAGLSFGTQWAFTNAFIPGVILPALAIGVAAGNLLDTRTEAPPRRRAAVVWALLAATLLCAPGGLDHPAGGIIPKQWRPEAMLQAPTGYDPRRFIPTARDRAQGDALIARLRGEPGPVLIPFHPFYGHLAGKPTFLHRMGVMDTWRAGMAPPVGLELSLMQSRFSAVVMDDKIDGNWQMWPGLLRQYRIDPTREFGGPPVVTGAQTHPRYWLVPIHPTTNLDNELQ